jgi:hypothetical protein
MARTANTVSQGGGDGPGMVRGWSGDDGVHEQAHATTSPACAVCYVGIVPMIHRGSLEHVQTCPAMIAPTPTHPPAPHPPTSKFDHDRPRRNHPSNMVKHHPTSLSVPTHAHAHAHAQVSGARSPPRINRRGWKHHSSGHAPASDPHANHPPTHPSAPLWPPTPPHGGRTQCMWPCGAHDCTNLQNPG